MILKIITYNLFIFYKYTNFITTCFSKNTYILINKMCLNDKVLSRSMQIVRFFLGGGKEKSSISALHDNWLCKFLYVATGIEHCHSKFRNRTFQYVSTDIQPCHSDTLKLKQVFSVLRSSKQGIFKLS